MYGLISRFRTRAATAIMNRVCASNLHAVALIINGFVRQFAVELMNEDKAISTITSTARLEALISSELYATLKRAAELQGAP